MEPGIGRERAQAARLANIRQELLAPVTAILGYAEMLREEAGRLELAVAAPDLERILAAAQELFALVDRLLDTDGEPAAQGSEGDAGAAQAQLRHDLRNPLNAIKGYAELLLEDLDGAGARSVAADLERLLSETGQLLRQIDVIVDFSRGDDGTQGRPGDASGRMVEDVMRSIRPLAPKESAQRETGRILVVDDNASNRDLVMRRLERDGHDVAGAASGRMALQTLRARAFDLVLLDLMMPDMNGYEVLEQIKGDGQLREIPVIMISGLRETDSVIRCIEAGAEDYLAKPFNPVLLRARIGACLERKRWHDRERYYLARLEAEKKKVEELLHSILPERVVARLSGGEVVIADRVEEVTIMFCDLVGFTPLASRLSPVQLVADLNRIFSAFDDLTRSLGIEKIKTIGDAYMAASGLPEPRPDHAEVMAKLALSMLEALDRLNPTLTTPLKIRIGMHSGPVVAGVIGTHRFLYDVWGDTVNLASRLEANGLANRIHISEQTRRCLRDRYHIEKRGLIDIKGVGKLQTFLLGGGPGG